MSTLHRRDICAKELHLLAQFSKALTIVKGDCGLLPYVLGEVEIWLPVWCLLGSGWKLSTFKLFKKETIGLETRDFRKICRYLRVREPELIDTLFRLSMLAVAPGVKAHEPRMYRMKFEGIPFDYVDRTDPSGAFGFIIESRRAAGNFRAEKV